MFDNEEHFDQQIILTFLCDYLALSSFTMADFVDLIGPLLRGAIFCCPSIFLVTLKMPNVF